MRHGGTGLFERFDADADGVVAQPELASGLYALWELSGEGVLSVDEWDAGVDRWFGEDDVNLAVGNWDRDGDGTISEAEFAAALEATDLFARADVDADVGLDADEFADTAFDAADADGDGLFSAEEDDGFFEDMAEALLDPEDDPDEPAADAADAIEDVDVADDAGPLEGEGLIERGESFVQLPIPCGEGPCEETAARFCEALGFEPPIDFVAAENSLYVVRCADEI